MFLRAESNGFEPVDPATLDQVSGNDLLVAAYAIIVGAIVVYSLILLLRERVTGTRITRLLHEIEHRPKR